MRLGDKVTPLQATPDGWVAAVQEKGYRAAYCPVPLEHLPDDVAYDDAAAHVRQVALQGEIAL